MAKFDPFQGKQGADRRARADTAIGKSSYEHRKDGDCIDPLCRGITIAVYDQPPFPDIADSLRRDLSAVGIRLQDTNVPYQDAFDPASHVAIVIGPPWSTDYPNASRSFVPMTGAMIAAVGNHNFSLTGASSTQLSAFGYPAADPQKIDGRRGMRAAHVGGTVLVLDALGQVHDDGSGSLGAVPILDDRLDGVVTGSRHRAGSVLEDGGARSGMAIRRYPDARLGWRRGDPRAAVADRERSGRRRQPHPRADLPEESDDLAAA